MNDNTQNENLDYVAMQRIQPNRFQPRTDFQQKELEELADSIEQQGLIQPIILRPIDDGAEDIDFELVAGERRWRAMQLLGKRRIRAIIKEDYNDEDSMQAALIENLQREDLNPMEEAESIKSFMTKMNLTQEQASQRLGKSRSYISNITRIVKLPDEVKASIRSGELEKWHAMVLVGAPKEEITTLATKVIKGSWSVDTLKKKVASLDPKKAAKKAKKEKISPRQPSTRNLLLIEAPSAAALKALEEQLKAEDGYHIWHGVTALKHAKGLLDIKKEDK